MVSVFSTYTVEAKARQTTKITSIISASLHGDHETVQALSAFNIFHATR